MPSTTNHIGKNHLNSRACKTCALAKAKCVPRTEGLNTKCERCHRLKKDCARQTPSMKVRKPYKATRVAQLEEKIDGIVSLLQQQKSVNSQDTTSGNSPLVTNEDILPRPPPPLTEPEPPSTVTYGNHPHPHPPPKPLEQSKRQSVYEKSTNACLLAHINSNLEPSDMEIERLVKLYETEMTAKFPFVIIETGELTRKEWVLENPVLGKAVLMAASYFNLPRQTVYETELVRDLTDRIMVKRERTLELLQTILVFCGWYHYHCLGHPNLNNLLGLAIGLAGDLGLNKPPSSDKFKYPFGHSRATAGDFSRRSMEQKRALAGLFYLTSLVATGFQRIDAMRYSIHLDECIRVIEGNPEHSTDLLLVELVKVTNLSERIGQTVSLIQNESEILVPTALRLGSFQAELDTLKQGIPGAWKDDVILQLHHHLSAIRLYEVSLANNWTPKITTKSPQSTSTTQAIPPPLHSSHIQSLFTCLHHTRSFLTLILSLPPTTYLSQPITPWFLLAFTLMILARLSFYQNPLLPTWNLDFVREICDLSLILEELADRNENAKFVDINLITREEGEWEPNVRVDGEGKRVVEGWTDCFDKFARKIELVKCWYDQRVAGYRGTATASVSMPLGGWLRADNTTMESGNGGINEDITQEGTQTQSAAVLDAIVTPQVNSDGTPILSEIDTNPWNGFDDQNFWMDLDGEWDIEGDRKSVV